MRKFIKKILSLFVLSAFAYVIFCATVYFFPEEFLYEPLNEHPNINNVRGDEREVAEVSYESADGTKLFGWYMPSDKKGRIVVFMHGNSFNIEKFYDKLVPFNDAGFAVFMGEYRGFGGIKGKITQKNLEEDAIAAVKYVKSLGYENEDIIIYGMSLGSHMALNTIVSLQEEGEFDSLILEVPFDSLINVVRDTVNFPLPIDLIIKDKYDNIGLVEQITTPLMINASEDDEVVPIERTKNLFEAANDPKMIIVYNGASHSGLYEHDNYETLIMWLQ